MTKGLQNIHFSFGEDGLTYFAGIPIIYQFAKTLHLKRFFQRQIHLSHRNTYYHWSDLLLSHFYYTIAGIERLDHLTTLKQNGLLPPLTGLPRLPGTRAMRDFLLGLTSQDLIQIEKVHDLIRDRIFQYPSVLTTAIVDLDSSVITVYGHQELAEVGYNPTHKGKRSYRPLFATESHLKISLKGQLRPGNFSDKTEIVPFIKSALEKIPSTIEISRIRIRADAGFYCWPVINFCDQERYGYVIVAQVTSPIKRELGELKYHIFNHKEKLAVAEFQYQPYGWKQPHRFVVIRYTLPPETETRQRTLFTIDRYEYQVFVTNLDLEPENVWYFYKGRTSLEINIKELKMDFFMSKIPTRKFSSNQAHLQLLLLDYDLFRWFQMLCLPPTISIQNTQMDTTKSFYSSREICYSRTQKRLTTSKKLYSATFISTDIQKCKKSENITKIAQFADEQYMLSDEPIGKYNVFPHFLSVNPDYFVTGDTDFYSKEISKIVKIYRTKDLLKKINIET